MATANEWSRILAAYPEGPKRRILEQMTSAFKYAAQAWFETATAGTETNAAVLKAGAFAWYSLRNIAEAKRLLGAADDGEVVEKMQGLSDWLDAHGWHGIRGYMRAAGGGIECVARNARDMYGAMRAYHEAGARILRAARAARKAA